MSLEIRNPHLRHMAFRDAARFAEQRADFITDLEADHERLAAVMERHGDLSEVTALLSRLANGWATARGDYRSMIAELADIAIDREWTDAPISAPVKARSYLDFKDEWEDSHS